MGESEGKPKYNVESKEEMDNIKLRYSNRMLKYLHKVCQRLSKRLMKRHDSSLITEEDYIQTL